MKYFEGVTSTMKNIPSVEVNVDTVYIRNNIKTIDLEGVGVKQYDEIQYSIRGFVEKIFEDLDKNIEEVSNVWFDGMMKDIKIENNEEELANLWFEILGGEL